GAGFGAAPGERPRAPRPGRPPLLPLPRRRLTTALASPPTARVRHPAPAGPPVRGSLRVQAAAAECLVGAVSLDEGLDRPELAGERGRSPLRLAAVAIVQGRARHPAGPGCCRRKCS